MARYCVNKNAQTNGDHEVHNLNVATSCLPEFLNRYDLGEHPNCRSAVAAAKNIYAQSNGCAICTPECHTQ